MRGDEEMSWFKYVWIILIILFWLSMTGFVIWDIKTTVEEDRKGHPKESLISSIILAIDGFSGGWIAFNIAVLFVASLICWLKYM